jgi:hypothetical protein
MNIQSIGINCHSSNYLFSVLLAVHGGHSDAALRVSVHCLGSECICSLGGCLVESLSGTFTTRAAIEEMSHQEQTMRLPE